MASNGTGEAFACTTHLLLVEEAPELRQLISKRASSRDSCGRTRDARIIKIVSCCSYSTDSHPNAAPFERWHSDVGPCT
jgi:hypothetical protein